MQHRIKKEREIWLDIAKGIATIFVVLGHIMNGYIEAGIFASDNILMTIIHRCLYSFHMPLFFILSGYAFSLAYINKEKSKTIVKHEKIKKQLINILLLYGIWSVLQWIVKISFSSFVNTTLTTTDLLATPFHAVSPYWYLYVLAGCYLITWLIAAKHIKTKVIFPISLLLCVAYTLIETKSIEYFTVVRIIPYFLFFYIGVILNQNKGVLKKISNPWVILLSFVTGTAILTPVLIFSTITWWNEIPVIGIIAALSFSLLIIGISQKIKSKILETLGKHSLEIYVIHCFLTATNRTILLKLGITNFYFNVAINFIVSTYVPVLCSILAQKIHIYNLLFKPSSLIDKAKSFTPKQHQK